MALARAGTGYWAADSASGCQIRSMARRDGREARISTNDDDLREGEDEAGRRGAGQGGGRGRRGSCLGFAGEGGGLRGLGRRGGIEELGLLPPGRGEGSGARSLAQLLHARERGGKGISRRGRNRCRGGHRRGGGRRRQLLLANTAPMVVSSPATGSCCSGCAGWVGDGIQGRH